MVEGGMKCVKYLVFFFNFVFVISGIALVALGAVIKGYYNKYLDFLGDDVLNVPILLIFVGVVIFFVAFMGCCGAIKENYCMTMTFGILLGIIFILELAAGIAGYVLRDEIMGTLDENMQKTMDNYGKEGYGGVTKTWDGMQKELNCCGVANYTDWSETQFGRNTSGVPDSCCRLITDGCGKGVLNLSPVLAAAKVHTDGCVQEVGREVRNHWRNYVIAGSLSVIVQILAMFFGFMLAREFRRVGYVSV